MLCLKLPFNTSQKFSPPFLISTLVYFKVQLVQAVAHASIDRCTAEPFGIKTVSNWLFLMLPCLGDSWFIPSGPAGFISEYNWSFLHYQRDQLFCELHTLFSSGCKLFCSRFVNSFGTLVRNAHTVICISKSFMRDRVIKISLQNFTPLAKR